MPGSAINWALLTSVIIIAIITFIFLKYTKKLPIGKFFKLASYMVAVLAVVLAGKGIMAFQEAGYVPVTPIETIPRIDILGIYPSLRAGHYIIFQLEKSKKYKVTNCQ